MEIDSISLILGIVIGAFGLLTGHSRRYKCHQMSIRRDLLFLLLIAGELAYVVIGGDELIAALIAVFIFFYFWGYRMADPRDWVGISTYSDDLMESFDRPLVWFTKDDVKYTVGQDLRSAFRGLFGIYDTVDVDFSEIRRTRTSRHSVGRRKERSLNVAAVSYYDVSDTGREMIRFGRRKVTDENGNKVRVPRYLITAPVKHHTIAFADCAETDPITFDTSVELRDSIVSLYVKEYQKNKRLEVQNIGLRYEDAAELVEGVFSLDLDSKNVEKEVLSSLAEEMLRRRNVASKAARVAFAKESGVREDGYESESDGTS